MPATGCSRRSWAGEVLFLGHHAGRPGGDLFLRLLRGSASRAWPACRRPGRWVAAAGAPAAGPAPVRQAYAAAQGPQWVEDPNADSALDRNFLRRDIAALAGAGRVTATTVLARASEHIGAAPGCCWPGAGARTVYAASVTPGSRRWRHRRCHPRQAALALRHWLLPPAAGPDQASLAEFQRQLGRCPGWRGRACSAAPTPAALPRWDLPAAGSPGPILPSGDVPGPGRDFPQIARVRQAVRAGTGGPGAALAQASACSVAGARWRTLPAAGRAAVPVEKCCRRRTCRPGGGIGCRCSISGMNCWRWATCGCANAVAGQRHPGPVNNSGNPVGSAISARLSIELTALSGSLTFHLFTQDSHPPKYALLRS